MPFKEKFKEGIISAKDFSREDIDYLLQKGKEMVQNNRNAELLKGKILATLFFEPSTRTRLSFESAMYRLGGNVIGFHTGEVSSINLQKYRSSTRDLEVASIQLKLYWIY
jgi:aspartate carbamoyltransferase catalytic subunit